ncbi:hypothetical protein BGZ83_002614, partial [Gryganskiella cystojenkinii]
AKQAQEVTVDCDVANKNSQKVRALVLPVDEGLMDIDTGGQVAEDDDFDRIEDLDIDKTNDDDEDD